MQLSAILAHREFIVTLTRIDWDIAAKAQQERCPDCGGPLHSACYSRKPRHSIELSREASKRFSFCCAVHGCRRRMTPPSVRFLDRRVWLGVVVVLITALTHGLTGVRLAKLQAELGVDIDRRTLARWRTWWQETFPQTPFWRSVAARFMPPLEAKALPGELVERFAANTVSGMVLLLRFLAPCPSAESAH